MTCTLFVKAPALVLLLCLALNGCRNGSRSAIDAPSIDPKAAAAAALGHYDKDGDGALSKAELAACPGLLPALADQQKLSRDRIIARLQSIVDSGVGMMPYTCEVYFNGSPLAGALVQIEPEPFLGADILAAEGKTDSAGQASLEIPDPQLPEDLRGLHTLQPGIYKVKVTHPSQKIATKYNTETTLGLEIYPIGRVKSAVFSLKSAP